MLPEQIPGSLFAIVLILIGYQYESPAILLLVALALACGWLSFAPLPSQALHTGVWVLTLLLFIAAFLVAVLRTI